jgi:hypothetical protein
LFDRILCSFSALQWWEMKICTLQFRWARKGKVTCLFFILISYCLQALIFFYWGIMGMGLKLPLSSSCSCILKWFLLLSSIFLYALLLPFTKVTAGPARTSSLHFFF